MNFDLTIDLSSVKKDSSYLKTESKIQFKLVGVFLYVFRLNLIFHTKLDEIIMVTLLYQRQIQCKSVKLIFTFNILELRSLSPLLKNLLRSENDEIILIKIPEFFQFFFSQNFF